ncbi:MAG: hypothetical protein ABI878_02020 [Acidobacteriota bacterium]
MPGSIVLLPCRSGRLLSLTRSDSSDINGKEIDRDGGTAHLDPGPLTKKISIYFGSISLTHALLGREYHGIAPFTKKERQDRRDHAEVASAITAVESLEAELARSLVL